MAEGNEQPADASVDLVPVTGGERKDALDTLRGIALLGILLMNIAAMGLPYAYSDPSIYGGAEGADLIAWITANLFFEGTMRGLFSLMFGAGVILIISRAEAKGGGMGVADLYFRRTLWLFLFGVVHAWLVLWGGDILYHYGISGLFIFAFRKLTPRTLIILGVLVLASLAPKFAYEHHTTLTAWEEAQAAEQVLAGLAEGEELDEENQGKIDAWQGSQSDAKPSAEKIEKAIEGNRGNYFEIIAARSGWIVFMQSTFYYQYGFFDVIGMMLIGMAFLKLGIITGEKSTRFYAVMMLAGYGIGLPVNAWETWQIVNSNFDILAMTKAHLTYDLGRLPVTLGHVGFWMLVCKSGWLRFLTSRLAAVGRMALTNYVMHSVITAFVFTGIGFGLYGALQRHELYYVVGGIWLFQLIVSPIWMRHFRFGPLEWVWRSLTYQKRQPMRREAIARA
jgi:uncharacterized protein